MSNFKKIKLLDIYIHDLSMNEAIDTISSWCHEEEDHFHHIITADAFMVNVASNDLSFREIVNNASMVTPDSSGVMLASKMYGNPIENKTPGCEIAENICRISGEKDIKIFFLGAKPEIVENAINKMKEKYKDTKITGYHHGFFKDEDNSHICKLIKDSNAQILFVALGIPKQEFWIRDNIKKTGVKVAIGVGGTFDVMSKAVARAPKIYQKLYLEWLYRYFQDPSKSYKIKKLPGFFMKVLRRKGENR